MPPRKLSLLISDIQKAVGRLQKLVEGMLLERFLSDETTAEAVLYNFAIIGESASKIPPVLREKYSTIPWPQMIGMRNIVIHEYFRIDLEILWDTIQNRLPELLPVLQQMLVEAGKEGSTPKRRKSGKQKPKVRG